MFNWWTFIFQFVNFFIVLYILYRLFFNPLKQILQKREEIIAERLQKIKEAEIRVKNDEEEYLKQIKEIQSLREKELDSARKKAIMETDILIKETDKELAKAFEKQSRILDQQRKKSEKEIKQKSIDFSLHYSEKLLKQLSSEELHKKRIEQFLQALPTSEEKEILLLKEELSGKSCDIIIYSPFDLQKSTIQKTKEVIGSLLQCQASSSKIVLDPSLIAGIRLVISNKVIDASIKGELERFKAQMENEL